MGYPHSPPAEGGLGQAAYLGFWAPRVCKDIDKWHLGQAGGHLVWGGRRPTAVTVGAGPAEAGANPGRGAPGVFLLAPSFWATSRELVLENWGNHGFDSRSLPQ